MQARRVSAIWTLHKLRDVSCFSCCSKSSSVLHLHLHHVLHPLWYLSFLTQKTFPPYNSFLPQSSREISSIRSPGRGPCWWPQPLIQVWPQLIIHEGLDSTTQSKTWVQNRLIHLVLLKVENPRKSDLCFLYPGTTLAALENFSQMNIQPTGVRAGEICSV